MADLADGESIEVQGSGKKPYVLKNTGGVYSCTCPAWRNQSLGIEQRTCKHLRKLRGDEAEKERIGNLPERAKKATGEKPTKPPLLLAHRWENDRDLTGWWMSEKLDGVRAYWDGKQFYSRLGNPFIAPDWFTADLPEVPLDGELWVGRKKFQKAVSIVRRQDAGKQWEDVRFLIFDAPAHGGKFEERIAYLEDLFKEGKAYADLVEEKKCASVDAMREELARIESLGGEGLMMRQPGSLYEEGRSTTLLKVKSFFDAEARVVDHLPGSGRHKGRLGALDVVTPEGVRFSVGTGLSDAEREAPPAIGRIITYRYQELTDAGVPRFPSFIGVRDDYQWPSNAVSVLLDNAGDSSKTSPEESTKTTEVSGKARRFELVDDKSSKFWEITVDGDQHKVRYGRIDTNGQTKTKSFADAAAAERDAEKLINAKVRKGYSEVGS